MEKEQINKKDGNQTPKNSAPADKGGAQTATGYGSQLPKSTDTPGIYGSLFGGNDGSLAPKRYKDVITKHHVNQKLNNPHDTPQQKQGACVTTDPLMERLSWEE